LPVLGVQAAPANPYGSIQSHLSRFAEAAQVAPPPQTVAPRESMAAAATASSWTVVASGLDNPRGLTFGPNGALYVAEAGRGGAGPCFPGPEGTSCFGQTGAITRVWQGEQTRIVDSLPSLADPEGFAAIGPVDVSMSAGKALVAVLGGVGTPENRNMLGPVGAALGHAIHVTPGGQWIMGVDALSYEAIANPHPAAIDSNPYSLAPATGGGVIADAGGNDLLSFTGGLGGNGSISTLAVFPDRMVAAPPFLGLPPGATMPMQAVPNSVVKGPDGAYYVGQLTGFPFPVGGANVYRVVPGEQPQVYAEGFTNIIDIAFGPDGSLYVLEIAANSLLSDDPTGALIRVAPDGAHTTIAGAGLVAPGGLAVGPDSALYVSNFGIFPGMGQVVRIQP
jgi:hypothetical protein